jgi:hypothetical protein
VTGWLDIFENLTTIWNIFDVVTGAVAAIQTTPAYLTGANVFGFPVTTFFSSGTFNNGDLCYANPVAFGPTGYTGYTGYTGSTGSTGQSGPTGPTGAGVGKGAAAQVGPIPTISVTSTSFAMCGLGYSGPFVFTPTQTGRVEISISASLLIPTNGSLGECTLAYGTGTAPSNGAAASGTLVGGIAQLTADAANSRAPFSVSAVLTGLVLNTQYWVDLQALNTTGGATTSVNQSSFSAVEF